jgi:hypothetical protein
MEFPVSNDWTRMNSEPASIREIYGEIYGYTPGKPACANNGRLARRLVERGVRFVPLCHRYWNMHGVTYDEDILNKTTAACFQTDQSAASLIQDLKNRGLLDTTMVIRTGEFGRTPLRQPGPYVGREYHPKGFTIWMAGGGVQRGTVYGETDKFSYHSVVNPVTPFDITATALYLLGIDHTKPTCKFAGRHFRPTDIEAL